jgi:hypothetical protein
MSRLTRTPSNASSETQSRTRRQRGLGPFSGAQLTLIIVTLAIVLGFPFAVGAVTGSNVFVTDATSGAHAKVDTIGNVQTKVNGGTLAISGGTLAAQPGPAAATYSNITGVGGGCGIVAVPPTGKAIIVTSILIDVESNAPTQAQIARATGSCPSFLTFVRKAVITNLPLGAFIAPFPSGIAIPNGQELIVGLSNGASGANVSVNGYLVPASQCQSPNVCN